MKSTVLDGINVLDFGWIGVGPITASYLGDYGADVVHLESSGRPDSLRFAPPSVDRVRGINNSMFFGDFNRSKRGLGINLATEQGQEVVKRMVNWADIVVENFRPGAMDNFGFDYASLKKMNPSIIMLSTCMQGQTGPRAKYAGYGNLMAGMCGFYEITGYPDDTPVPIYGAFTDMITPRLNMSAILMALEYRDQTGKGQWIDNSQYEGSLQHLGTELLDYEVNGTIAKRNGNRSDHAAPQGVYPCRGDDRWIAIAVATDEEWQALKSAMGQPEWAEDARFSTLLGRKKNENELDANIAEWTIQFAAIDLMYTLQPQVAAGVVHDQTGLLVDDQIKHRGYYVWLDHTHMGSQPFNGNQAELSKSPPILSRPSPCLGEHTREILKEVARLDDAEIDQLFADNIIEQTV